MIIYIVMGYGNFKLYFYLYLVFMDIVIYLLIFMVMIMVYLIFMVIVMVYLIFMVMV